MNIYIKIAGVDLSAPKCSKWTFISIRLSRHTAVVLRTVSRVLLVVVLPTMQAGVCFEDIILDTFNQSLTWWVGAWYTLALIVQALLQVTFFQGGLYV